ncbi:MAG: acetoin:2,6-dichlorophenolindophenol oxidoreductase subunit alpha [Baekduia sp.]|nr:acetoin:2,6-dichlorophenolindophenol oxidoreductase subunit alpha [Baekduia sp.]
MATSTKHPQGQDEPPAAGLPGRDAHLELHARMTLIRGFEDAVQRLFTKGEVHGTTHLYSGQEAGATGVCSVLQDGDRIAGTYRGHGHALAKGVDPAALMAEMLGRATGVCGGRAGSMNVIDVEHGLIGCFGIIGGSTTAATGAALALRRTGNVAVAFFGEGTGNQGYFHESLNFAKVLSLPVVYVCENNRYAEFTPFEEAMAGTLADRPRAMEIPTTVVDGMDVTAVQAAAAEAVDRARAGGGPQFIESLTYRFVGHSRSDPGRYRKEGELEEWKQRDPLLVSRAILAERHGVAAAEVDAVEEQVAAELAAAIETARSGPWPEAGAAASEFRAVA